MVCRYLVPILALAACSDSSAPTRIPETRSYQYSFTSPGPGEPVFSGTATITYADEDSVSVVFDVPGHRPEHDLGGWNAGAYVVWARRIDDPFGTPVHRLRATDDGLTCEGFWRFGGSEYPATCEWK